MASRPGSWCPRRRPSCGRIDRHGLILHPVDIADPAVRGDDDVHLLPVTDEREGVLVRRLGRCPVVEPTPRVAIVAIAQPLPIACSCDAPLFCRADRPVTTRAWLARCGRRRLDIARPERREDRRPAVPRSDGAGAATPLPPQHVGRDRRRPPDESADRGEPHVGERLADAAQPRHRRRFPKRHQPARSRSSVGRTLRCRRGSGPSSGNVVKSTRRASNEVGEGPGANRDRTSAALGLGVLCGRVREVGSGIGVRPA